MGQDRRYSIEQEIHSGNGRRGKDDDEEEEPPLIFVSKET